MSIAVNQTVPAARQSTESFAARFRRAVPTAIVLLLIAGLGWLGHITDWTIPRFDELMGGTTAVKDDWCLEHNVPGSICVECDETLMPRGKSTWCRKHGVHNCPFENPDVVQVKTAAVISQDDLDRAQRALDLKERKENNPKCKLHHRRIQFASEEIFNKMGVEIEPVWRGPIIETVAASGEIGFDQPRVASVSATVGGRVWLVTEKGQLGAEVKRGDVLALVDAIEVGKAKAEILQAFAQVELRKRSLDLLKPLTTQGVIPESKLLEADLALRESRIRLMGARQAIANMGLPLELDETQMPSADELAKKLQFHGIPLAMAAKLDAKQTSANLMPVVASHDGFITAAKVTTGEMVEPSRPLFVIADTSTMWLILHVRLEDAQYLRVRDAKTNVAGQMVRFKADGSKQEITGELVWKSREIDDKTRTLRYRADLPNHDGSLLANTFGTGHVVLREEKNAIIVPNEAVHWDGDCHIVFVRDKNYFESDKKVFHVRTVRVGVMHGNYTEIIAGVLPGEVVATKNSAAIRSELLKSNLGAGCTCCH